MIAMTLKNGLLYLLLVLSASAGGAATGFAFRHLSYAAGHEQGFQDGHDSTWRGAYTKGYKDGYTDCQEDRPWRQMPD